MERGSILCILENHTRESCLRILIITELDSDERAFLDSVGDILKCDGIWEVEKEYHAHLIGLRLALGAYNGGDSSDGLQAVAS